MPDLWHRGRLISHPTVTPPPNAAPRPVPHTAPPPPVVPVADSNVVTVQATGGVGLSVDGTLRVGTPHQSPMRLHTRDLRLVEITGQFLYFITNGPAPGLTVETVPGHFLRQNGVPLITAGKTGLFLTMPKTVALNVDLVTK